MHARPQPQPLALEAAHCPSDPDPHLAADLDAEQERRQRRNVIASSIVGNVLEWYDFLVFAYEGVVISKLFFPNTDTYTRYLSVYGVFAAGFITRPAGALFFGWLGDRYSRKTALLASIYTMSVPTFAMGCLPTYAAVGRLAPWLLVLTRVVQGFAVGGEFTATMVFLVEHAPPGQEGLQGSWAFFSVMVGVLFGSGVAMLFNYALTDEQLYSWGWRLPFMLSILGAGVGAYMRRNVPEPPSHHRQHPDPDPDPDLHVHSGGAQLKSPDGADGERSRLLRGDGDGDGPARPPALAARLAAVLRRPAARAVLGAATVFVIDFLTALGFYLLVIFLPTFFQEFSGLSRRQAMSVHTANMVLYMALTPVGGLLSDRVGRLPLVIGPGLAVAALAYPCWRLLSSSAGSVVAAAEGQALLVIVMSIFNGSLAATFVALFRPEHRCTGVSVGHNLSMALCGGTAPLIATALLKRTGDSCAPAFMLIAAGLLTALGGVMARCLFQLK